MIRAYVLVVAVGLELVGQLAGGTKSVAVVGSRMGLLTGLTSSRWWQGLVVLIFLGSVANTDWSAISGAEQQGALFGAVLVALVYATAIILTVRILRSGEPTEPDAAAE